MKELKYKYSYFSIRAFLRIIRWHNLTIIALTQLMTAFFLIKSGYTTDQKLSHYFIFLVISTVLVAAAGYVINDYYDIKIDEINRPSRVIVGRQIRRRIAIFLHVMLNLTALGFALAISLKVAILIFIIIFWLWLYSNLLKRLPFYGNITIAALSSGSILLVGAFFNDFNFFILAYSFLGFIVSLIREIIKDTYAMRGDINYGCRTLPIIWGIRKVKNFVFLLMGILFLSLLGIIIYLQDIQIFYLFILISIPFGVVLLQLKKADRRKDFYMLNIACKGLMLAGIISMIFV
jgi:4-hydroxybenzoate polyprenyltransferase